MRMTVGSSSGQSAVSRTTRVGGMVLEGEEETAENVVAGPRTQGTRSRRAFLDDGVVGVVVRGGHHHLGDRLAARRARRPLEEPSAHRARAHLARQAQQPSVACTIATVTGRAASHRLPRDHLVLVDVDAGDAADERRR